jgi:hypothetical protein
MLCNSNGGKEGFFGRRVVCGIALEKNVAANAVQEGVSPMFSGLGRERQSFVNPGQGSLASLSAWNSASKPQISGTLRLFP